MGGRYLHRRLCRAIGRHQELARLNPSPSTGQEPDGHVYDLWHAAINSRGKFFNAGDPVSLNTAFNSIFTSIISTNAASAAAAANSASIQTGTVLFQAQFNSQSWSGHLFNFSVSSTGSVLDLNKDGKLDCNDANWDAANYTNPVGCTQTGLNGYCG